MKFILFILLNTAAFSCYSASETINELRESYQSSAVNNYWKGKQQEVDRLPFFIQHFEDKEGPEKARLDTYLMALQDAMKVSYTLQKRTHQPTWFCPPSDEVLSRYTHPDAIKNLIVEVIERSPESFARTGKYKDLVSIVAYGLQVKYPCFSQTPDSWKIPGFVYNQ